MKKNNFYTTVGILVFLIPFLGIPGTWRNITLSLLGLVIFFYSLWPQISKTLSKKPTSVLNQVKNVKKKEESLLVVEEITKVEVEPQNEI